MASPDVQELDKVFRITFTGCTGDHFDELIIVIFSDTEIIESISLSVLATLNYIKRHLQYEV